MTRRMAVVAVIFVLAACGSVRSDRRATSADVCAGTLPAGQASAGRQLTDAELVRIKRLTGAAAAELLASLQAPALPTPLAATQPVCALVYSGHPINATATGRGGPVLLVIATTRHAEVLTTVLLNSVPFALRH